MTDLLIISATMEDSSNSLHSTYGSFLGITRRLMLKEGATKSKLGMIMFNRFNFSKKESHDTSPPKNQEKLKIRSSRLEKLGPASQPTAPTNVSQTVQPLRFDFLEIRRDIIERCLFQLFPKQFATPMEALEYFDTRFRMLRAVLQRAKMYLGFSAGHLEEMNELFVFVASAESEMLNLLKRNGIPVT